MKLRYIMAQGVILFFWASDWYRRGASYEGREDEVSLVSFIVLFLITLAIFFLAIFPLALIPAILVGIVDGLVGKRNEGPLRSVLLSVLVVSMAAYISWVGIDALKLEDLFGQENSPPSASGRIQTMISVELIFLLEFGFATSIHRLRGE